MSLSIGDHAPQFTLPDENGEPFNFSDQHGARLLLVFYPGDGTPVCTRQLCDYRDGIDAFRDLQVKVVGVSGDNADSHKQFKSKYNLPFTLLTDDDSRVAKLYGCQSMLGMRRGLFLIDEVAVIRYRHIESVALFRRHRAEVLSAIEQLEQ